MKHEFTSEIILIDPGPDIQTSAEALKNVLGSNIKFVNELVRSINRTTPAFISDFDAWNFEGITNLISKKDVLITFSQPKPFISISFKSFDAAFEAATYLKNVGMTINLITINQIFRNELENILLNKDFLNEGEL